MRHFLLLVLMVLPAITWGNQTKEVVIQDAWVREAPPGVTTLAGYMNVINNSPETVVLQKLSSPDFERVELHQTRIEGNVARMEKKNSLTLSPGSTVELQPGGFHLMLFKPERPMQAGDKVTFTIDFKDQLPRTIEAEVRAVRDDTGSHQHHH